MNRIFDPDDPIDLPFETRPDEGSDGEIPPVAAAFVAVPPPGPAGPDVSREVPAAAGALDAAPAGAMPPSGIPAVSGATAAPPAAAPLAAPAAVPAAPASDAPASEAAGAAAEADTAAASGAPISAPAAAPARSRAPSRRPSVRLERLAERSRRPDDRLLLISALAGVCMVSVAGSLLYFGYWNRLQQSLTQERNLLLVERLRSLGPAASAPAPAPVAPELPAPAGVPGATAVPPPADSGPAAEGLPPPPPEEPWIEQLSSLPRSPQTPSRVLTVPVSPGLGASAPAARPSAAASQTRATPSRAAAPRASAPLPQLVGVVAGAGRSPSAIFLVGGSSLSVATGDVIGSSGWRLRSAEGETALIERDGEVRQISIASGNGF